MLFHVVYASTATADFSRRQLLEILQIARLKNHRQDITGVLLHHQHHFFQVIEGPHDAVEALYSTIEKDTRHTQVVKIIEEPIFQRDFPNWTMGLAEVDEETLQLTEGLNDYLQQGAGFAALNPGRAGKLMQAFKQGRWHQRINASDAFDGSRVPTAHSPKDSKW